MLMVKHSHHIYTKADSHLMAQQSSHIYKSSLLTVKQSSHIHKSRQPSDGKTQPSHIHKSSLLTVKQSSHIHKTRQPSDGKTVITYIHKTKRKTNSRLVDNYPCVTFHMSLATRPVDISVEQVNLASVPDNTEHKELTHPFFRALTGRSLLTTCGSVDTSTKCLLSWIEVLTTWHGSPSPILKRSAN